MFAVGDIIYAEDQKSCGTTSLYYWFARVLSITKTGRYNIGLLDKIADETHEKTQRSKFSISQVVSPDYTKTTKKAVLNADKTIRCGEKYYISEYVEFEKYTPELVLVEEYDLMS